MVLVSLGVLAAAAPSASGAPQAPAADLALALTDKPDPVAVGADLRYTLVVTNNGPDAATAAAVDDTLPDQTSFGSATSSQGTGCSELGGAVHCDLGSIGAASSASVHIRVAPLAHGTLHDAATASSSTADPNSGNNDGAEDTTATGANCTIVGTWGHDDLSGTAADDVLCTLGGNDTLAGRAGGDVLAGGSGVDTATYASSSHRVSADLASGKAKGQGADTLTQVENVVGSSHDDFLAGSTGPNTLQGGAGTDLLYGRGGNDHLVGGGGADYLAGGLGNDALTGGRGADTCLQNQGSGSRDCPGQTRPDGNDTAGRFDVSQVRVSPGRPLGVRITTFSRWTVYGVWDSGFVVVFIDSTGTPRPDYEVLIRSNGSHMVARLRFASGVPIEGVPVRRPNARSVAVSIPFSPIHFGPGRRYYRWQVESIWNAPPCGKVCFDLDDNAGGAPEPRP